MTLKGTVGIVAVAVVALAVTAVRGAAPAGPVDFVAHDIDADDLVITKSGAVYLVDTAQKTVGYIDAKGQRRSVYNRGEIMKPSALTLSPDQAMLLVADGMDRYQW